VILSPVRDANPYFHMVECAWLLAGRNDVASLTPYVKNFERYAEPGGVVHGAYGHRWRKHFGYDQLGAVVNKLKGDPGTRQAVIQMWDASFFDDRDVMWRTRDDDGRSLGADDLSGDFRDRPCNLLCVLRISPGETQQGDAVSVLDMTVMNRSHDVIWGLLGANAVHFAVLQENLAARLDIGIGDLTFCSLWN